MRGALVFWLIFFGSILQAALSGPQLLVKTQRGKSAPLRIVSYEAEVYFVDDVAETAVTVTFGNPTSRVLEGILTMPLPGGATVSGYALDVDGAMREGVVVEKKRAIRAYEAIKSLGIDPGYVIRENDNVYRTKIFPIPPKGTKAVRLTYCEILPRDRGERESLCYRLPLPEGQLIESATFKLVKEGQGSFDLIKDGGFRIEKSSSRLVMGSRSRGRLGDFMEVRLDAPERSAAYQVGEHFYFRDRIQDLQESPLTRAIRKIDLLWDHSASGLARDVDSELALLDELFSSLQNVTVNLTLLGFEKRAGESFEIENGDWEQLKDRLRGLDYDGTWRMPEMTLESDLVLLVSDGLETPPAFFERLKSPLFLLDSRNSAQPAWRHLCRASGGDPFRFPLSAKGIFDQLKEEPRISLEFEGVPKPKILRTGHMLANEPDRFIGTFRTDSRGRLLFQRDDQESEEISLVEPASPRHSQVLRKIIGQTILDDLEARSVSHRDEILAHCKEFGVIGDTTSFVVLERFEAHVRYRIPPPEPDLRIRYDEALSQKRDKSPEEILESLWDWRQRWHHKDYPGHEIVLREPLERVNLWTTAVRKTFSEDQIDQVSLKALDLWRSQASQLMAERPRIQFQEDFDKWIARLRTHKDRVEKFRTDDWPHDPGLDDLHVSVRGLVNNPGNYSIDSETSLGEVLEKAGGLNYLAAGHPIALYRNATKDSGLISKAEFAEQVLKANDMIVAEDWQSALGAYDGFLDPFGGERPRPANPESRIVEVPFLPIKVHLSESADWAAFEAGLANGENPEKAYRTLRSGRVYEPFFYLRVADKLRRSETENLIDQVTSNLLETHTREEVPVSSSRLAAYYFAQQGQWEEAEKLLQRVANQDAGDSLTRYDLAWLAEKKGNGARGADLLNSAMVEEGIRSRGFSELVLADRIRIKPGPGEALLNSDLRIVVVSSDPSQDSFSVEEPVGNRSHRYGLFSKIGGRLIKTKGASEYVIKKAAPGNYGVAIKAAHDQIVRVLEYRNWGREEMTVRESFVSVEASEAWQTVYRVDYRLPSR